MKLMGFLSVSSPMELVVIILVAILWCAFLGWAVYKVITIFLRGLRNGNPKDSRR